MTVPSIRIIIVNYNGGAYLGRCIAAVLAQSRSDFELIIADNGSTDGSCQSLPSDPRLSVRWLGSNLGFAVANNRAAADATGRWLVLLNPDAFPDPDWLARLVEDAEATGAAMVGSTQLMDDHPDRYDGAGDAITWFGMAWRGGYRQPVRSPHPSGECFSPCAAAALYDRALFQRVGGFDESFFIYGEDVDLGWRLRLAGGRCYQSARAVVRHVGSGLTGRGSDFARYHGFRNQVWGAIKCLPTPLLPLALGVHLLAMLLLTLRALPTGGSRAMLRALRDGVLGSGPYWRARCQHPAQSRWAAVRAMSWNPLAFLRRAIGLRPWESL